MKADLQFTYVQSTDLPSLVEYLEHLSPMTRQRFGPHPFDAPSIAACYADPFAAWGFVAKTAATATIVAYAVVKRGGLAHEMPRLARYGLQVHPWTDCTFAPSVADAWQGQGIGIQLFQFLQDELRRQGIRRMFLWGGVQADNEMALRFYQKMGFQTLGYFEHQGGNWDMYLEW